jgi:dienelactone hydrolase
MTCAIMAAVRGHAAAGPAAAQTPTVPLPSDVKITPPASDVPENLSRFVGAWAHGAWDDTLPHVLVVETVESTGRAAVVYAFGDLVEGGVNRGYRRVTGRIVADLLMFDLREGTSVVYQHAGDSLRGTYTSRGGRSTVTLTRATLAQATTVPAIVLGVITGTTIRIPMAEPGPGGGPVTLEATFYRPGTEGPYPVVLFNHGSAGGGAVSPRMTLRPSRPARFFVERGFAVLAPMRWADPARMLVAGQSRGGRLSVVYATERPGTVRGAINFAGGWTSQRCDESGRGFNGGAFAAAAGRPRVPMPWLYAEPDTYYSAMWIRRYHEAFAQAGGVATFHLFPAFDAMVTVSWIAPRSGRLRSMTSCVR